MKTKIDLGSERILPVVCSLAIPTMLAQFVNVLYSIVDRMYIGNIEGIGGLALAGVGVCGPVLTLISSFASLVGLGGSPLIAMFLGRGQRDRAGVVVSNGFTVLIALAGLLTAICLLSKESLLMLFGASEATFEYADTYFTIYVSGTVFSLLATGLNSYLIAQGYSGRAMFTVVLGAVMNIALDPVFIFLFKMDTAGAAIATVISQMCSCAAALFFLLRKGTYVRLTLGRPEMKLVLKMLSFGTPSFLILGLDSVLLIALNSALQHYGGSGEGDILVTCATIVQSWYSLITVPMCGITEGAQPAVSFNYGAGNAPKFRRAIYCIAALSLVYCALMTLASHTVSGLFAGIFSGDAEIRTRSVGYIRVFTAMIIPLAIQYTIVDELTALGRVRASLFCSLFRKALFLTCICVIPMLAPIQSAFLCEPIADGAGTVVSCCVFAYVFPKALRECRPVA